MARVTYVKRCRKAQVCDRCGAGVNVGEPYRHWAFRYGPTRKRCMKPECNPRPQDLTQNDFLIQQYDLNDRIRDAEVDDAESIADDIEALADEQEEKVQNMPDSLQDGEIADMLNERAESLREWAERLKEVAERDEDEDQLQELREIEYEGE